MKTMILGSVVVASLMGIIMTGTTKMADRSLGQFDELDMVQTNIIEAVENKQSCAMLGQAQHRDATGKLPKCGDPVVVQMPAFAPGSQRARKALEL
jgi:hypothetical protein